MKMFSRCTLNYHQMQAALPCCKNLLAFSGVVRMQSRHSSYTRQFYKKEKEHIGSFGYFLATIPVAAFCLGCWQVQRRKWKLGLIHQLEQRTSLPPVPLPYSLEDVSELEFQRVHVHGRFDHSKEMYIQPRSLITNKGESKEGGLISAPKSGSWVITPFHLSDRDCTILVNRGWIQKRKPDQRWEKLNDDEVDLVGIVRLTEQRVPLASKHLTNDNINWNRRDVERMAHVSGAQPIFIDAVAESSQPGGPIGGQTRITLRNEHMSYIFTWFSLSAATALLWYLKFLKKAV